MNPSEGVLNNLGNQFAQGITAKGLTIDSGSNNGQSTDLASPFANDQMRLYSRKEWPSLPFYADDVAKARVGDVLRLKRP